MELTDIFIIKLTDNNYILKFDIFTLNLIMFFYLPEYYTKITFALTKIQKIKKYLRIDFKENYYVKVPPSLTNRIICNTTKLTVEH